MDNNMYEKISLLVCCWPGLFVFALWPKPRFGPAKTKTKSKKKISVKNRWRAAAGPAQAHPHEQQHQQHGGNNIDNSDNKRPKQATKNKKKEIINMPQKYPGQLL